MIKDQFGITVTIPERITPQQFGVSEDIFNRSIRGKELEVIRYDRGITFVRVEGEVYSIAESDLIPTSEKPPIESYGSYKGF